MKIYTKTGDKGTTQLVGGSRVSKGDLRVDCYGTVDELSSHLGKLLCIIQSDQNLTNLPVQILLTKIQHRLFVCGSILATENEETLSYLPKLSDSSISDLETSIDDMTNELPKLNNFILPGGHLTAAQTHVARTVCRRSERLTSSLLLDLEETQLEQLKIETKKVMVFLNRLSDWLFVAARYLNLKTGSPEVIWQKDI